MITKNKISRGTAHITWTKETIIKGLEILYGETFTSYIKSLNDIKYKTSEELITQGCVDDFTYRGVDFRIKRLCGYKLKPSKPTFKVVYSNGEKLDDWISQEKHDEMVKVKKLVK